MLYSTDDLRIESIQAVCPPVVFHKELPITEAASSSVVNSRKHICEILHAKEYRLLVVAGPCSIHDTVAAREYAELLKSAINNFSDELLIAMRVYFEKPRTTVGWKGLINDPHMNQTFKINDGLRIARHLLLDLAEMGVPAGTEFLEVLTPQYIMDLVTWGAIGARTTESQVHRELASGLSCPVGFKNGTSGDIQIAVEAVKAAAHPHHFMAQTKLGQSAIFGTKGNPDCHVILRGGRKTVNYAPSAVAEVCTQLIDAGLPARVMIDCSHANSNKDYRQQGKVCKDVAGQIASGDPRIFAVMLESNLVEGAQALGTGKRLVYGQSVTDSCIGWKETLLLFRELAEAVRARRVRNKNVEMMPCQSDPVVALPKAAKVRAGADYE